MERQSMLILEILLLCVISLSWILLRSTDRSVRICELFCIFAHSVAFIHRIYPLLDTELRLQGQRCDPALRNLLVQGKSLTIWINAVIPGLLPGANRRERELCRDMGKWGSQAEKAGRGGILEEKSTRWLVKCCENAAPEGTAQKVNARTFREAAGSSGWVEVVERQREKMGLEGKWEIFW